MSFDFSKNIQIWSSKSVVFLIMAAIALTIFLNINPLESLLSKSFDTSSAIAQNQPEPAASNEPDTFGKPIKVAVRIVPPFVIEKENQELDGFSIELWREIAKKLNVKSEFKIFKGKGSVTSVKEALKDKESQFDIGIGNIVVKKELREEFEFSQPILNSGLHILVHSQRSEASEWRVISSSFIPKLFQLLVIIIVLVLVPAHIVWFVERNHEGGFLEHSSYFPGIFKACWWAAATLATQAEEMPKGLWGRVMAVIWMFTSVVFIAYFTATVTSSLTADKLQSNIKGFADLRDKKVLVGRGRAETYLKNLEIKCKTVDGNEDAKEYLKKLDIKCERINGKDDTNSSQAAFKKFIDDNSFDAMVDDFHTLSYLLKQNNASGKVELVGNTVYKQNDAFLFPNVSQYIKKIDLALLSLQEEEGGQYQKIYDKWFKKE